MIITEILTVLLQLTVDNAALGAAGGIGVAAGGGVGGAIAKYQQKINSQRLDALEKWKENHDNEHKKLEIGLQGTLTAIHKDIEHIKNNITK